MLAELKEPSRAAAAEVVAQVMPKLLRSEESAATPAGDVAMLRKLVEGMMRQCHVGPEAVYVPLRKLVACGQGEVLHETGGRVQALRLLRMEWTRLAEVVIASDERR